MGIKAKERIPQLKRELDEVVDGSDIHWLLKKISGRLCDLLPWRPNEQNWEDAKGVLLFYTVGVERGILTREGFRWEPLVKDSQSLTECLYECFNTGVYELRERHRDLTCEEAWIQYQDKFATAAVNLCRYPI